MDFSFLSDYYMYFIDGIKLTLFGDFVWNSFICNEKKQIYYT